MPETRRAKRLAELQKAIQGDKQLNAAIIKQEVAKINELLTQFGFAFYCGYFFDFLSQFVDSPLKHLLQLDRAEEADVTFVKQFTAILYDLCKAVSQQTVQASLPPDQQAAVWMCCILYLTVIGTEEYTTDLDTHFKSYFGPYLVARLIGPSRRKPANSVKLVCKEFNNHCCNLLVNNIFPRSLQLS
jgi:hypothetical protein